MTDHPEYTLSRPPSCPTNQDHLRLQAHFSLDSPPPFRLMSHWKRLSLDLLRKNTILADESSVYGRLQMGVLGHHIIDR